MGGEGESKVAVVVREQGGQAYLGAALAHPHPPFDLLIRPNNKHTTLGCRIAAINSVSLYRPASAGEDSVAGSSSPPPPWPLCPPGSPLEPPPPSSRMRILTATGVSWSLAR